MPIDFPARAQAIERSYETDRQIVSLKTQQRQASCFMEMREKLPSSYIDLNLPFKAVTEFDTA